MVVALVGQAPSRGCARCPRARGSPLVPHRPRSRGTRHTSAALCGEASIASSSVCLAFVATNSVSFACSSRSSCASWLPLVRPIPSDPPITHRYTQAPMCSSSPLGVPRLRGHFSLGSRASLLKNLWARKGHARFMQQVGQMQHAQSRLHQVLEEETLKPPRICPLGELLERCPMRHSLQAKLVHDLSADLEHLTEVPVRLPEVLAERQQDHMLVVRV